MRKIDFNDFVEEPLIVIDEVWYRERYDVPETLDLAKQNELIKKFIDSATRQIDSICNGKISEELPNFKPDVMKDKREFNILQSCIGDWTEYMILTGKAFADLEQSIQASIPFDIRRSSLDSEIEKKRPDILRKLAQTRFYQTSGSISLNANVQAQIEEWDNLEDEQFLVLVSKLKKYFLTNDNTNFQNASIVFSKTGEMSPEPKEIVGTDNIISAAFSEMLPEALYPSLLGYVVRRATASEFSENALKVLFDNNYYSIQELIDVKGLAFFGEALTQALTREEIYNLLTAASIEWQPYIKYALGSIVQRSKQEGDSLILNSFISLIEDNIGHDPNDEPAVAPFDFWYPAATTIDVTSIVNKVKEYLDTILPGVVQQELDKLPTIFYTSEYANQTLAFTNEASFEEFKRDTGTTDVDYQDAPPDYYTKEEMNEFLAKVAPKVYFFAGQLMIFNSNSQLDSFTNKYGLIEGTDYRFKSDGFLVLSGAAGNSYAKENNGIINDNYMAEKDLSHSHTNRFYPAAQTSPTGGQPLYGKYSGSSITNFSGTYTQGIGSRNPKPVEKLLDRQYVRAIYFIRDVAVEVK